MIQKIKFRSELSTYITGILLAMIFLSVLPGVKYVLLREQPDIPISERVDGMIVELRVFTVVLATLLVGFVLSAATWMGTALATIYDKEQGRISYYYNWKKIYSDKKYVKVLRIIMFVLFALFPISLGIHSYLKK